QRPIPVSDFPIARHGERISAVVIGGGPVGTRKALALAKAGAHVELVSPIVTAELEEAARSQTITLIRESYRASHLDRATLVIAATDSRETNSTIASDAHGRGKLVNITDHPDEGNFHTM